MRLRKILKYSSIVLILLSVLLCTYFYVKKEFYLKKEHKLIVENKRKNQIYTKVPYIEIPSLGISKILEKDARQEILDRYQVVIWNDQKDLYKIRHLILAGHNVKNVFGPLHRIEKGALIYIYYKDQKDIYEVVEAKEISITETEYLEETSTKYLSLITCTENNQVRWLVKAKIKEP